MKRLIILVSVLVTVLLGGCASSDVMDTYSFGSQVIQSGKSEVTVTLPFEIGKDTKVKADENGYPLAFYANMDKHFFVAVRAISTESAKSLPTPQIAMQQEIERLRAVQGVSDITVKEESVTIDSVPMQKAVVTFRNQSQPISLLQYTFTDKGVLWSIGYRYRTNDETGVAISKFIEDKIQVTKAERGIGK